MMERGYIALARGVLDHPVVGIKAGRPYTRTEAWQWLLFEAAFKPRPYNAGGRVINLGRGQLAHSTRYMAKAWGWRETTVRRFLGCLKTGAGTGAMIGAETGAGITVITICNYESYQSVPAKNGAECGAGDGAGDGAKTAQERRRKEEGNNETSNSMLSGEPKCFAEWYAAYPRKTQRRAAAKAYGRIVPSQISSADLLARTLIFAEAWARRQKSELQYCPYPASWLNKGEYEDVAAAGPSDAPKPQRDPATFTAEEWLSRIRQHNDGIPWPELYWGPPPGKPGCLVPPELIAGQ